MSVRIPPPPNNVAATMIWLKDFYQEFVRLEAENRKLQRDLEVALDNRLILHDDVGERYVVDINPIGPAIRISAPL